MVSKTTLYLYLPNTSIKSSNTLQQYAVILYEVSIDRMYMCILFLKGGVQVKMKCFYIV